MKIQISDNNIMHTALAKAESYEYFEALRLFCKVDSYESQLNRIGCLCCLNEIFYAADLYRRVKSLYFDTRNVYLDVKNLGSATKTLLVFADLSRLSYSETHGDSFKIPPDDSLLCKYETAEDERASQPDFDYYSDMLQLESDTPRASFADVKSDEYLDSLRVNLEKAYLFDDKKEAAKLTRSFLQLETEHVPTLETQIALCLYEEKFDKGVKYAVKLADALDKDVTVAGVCGAIEILLKTEAEEYRETLKKLLDKALLMGDKILSYDLSDYVTVCQTKLKDAEMSYKFARLLYADCKNAGLESLRKCACAFYNYGDKTSAKEAAITLLNVMPDDFFANVMLDYVNYSQGAGKLILSDKLFSYFSLPVVIAYFLQKRLDGKRCASEGGFTLDSDDYAAVSALIYFCRYNSLERNIREVAIVGSFLRTCLDHARVEKNCKELQRFVLQELALMLPEEFLSESLLRILIKTGYRNKAMIAVGEKYYYLDLSQLTVSDGAFISALCVCAVMRPIEIVKMQNAYLKLKSAILRELRDDVVNARKTAYCLLSIAYPNFTQSAMADNFAEDEKEIYEEYSNCANG